MRTSAQVRRDIVFLKYEIKQARAFNESEKELEYLYNDLETLEEELIAAQNEELVNEI